MNRLVMPSMIMHAEDTDEQGDGHCRPAHRQDADDDTGDALG